LTLTLPTPRHHLRAWRKHRGLTQAELAQAMGISRPYLTKVERGDRRYDQSILEAAASALGCTVDDLIARDPAESAELADIWNVMTPAQQTRALAVLRATFNAPADH
jgi:transcriptional regulator with XRE-family HTH domain